MEKKIERVILSDLQLRPEKAGLPGDMKEKVDLPKPLYDALYELFGADKLIEKLKAEK